MSIWILAIIIMLIAFVMTMTGRGGGNFYVLTLVIAGISMNISASTGQFILMCSSLMAAILFSKQKMNHFIGSFNFCISNGWWFFRSIF